MKTKQNIVAVGLLSLFLSSCLNNKDESPPSTFGDQFYPLTDVDFPPCLATHVEKLMALDTTKASVVPMGDLGAVYYSQLDSSAIVTFSGQTQWKGASLEIDRVQTRGERSAKNTHDSVSFLQILEYELRFLEANGVVSVPPGWIAKVVTSMQAQTANRSTSGDLDNVFYQPSSGEILWSGVSDSVCNRWALDSGYASGVQGAGPSIWTSFKPASKIIPHFVAPVLDSL